VRRTSRFCEKVFGVQSRRVNDRTWSQVGRSRVGLQNAADGEHAGVHRLGVAAEAFNYDLVVARLRALGATVERPEIQGAPAFRIPTACACRSTPPREFRLPRSSHVLHHLGRRKIFPELLEAVIGTEERTEHR